MSSINHFRCYLYGTKFLVRTDHAALQWLHNFKEPTGQVSRWLEKLAEYNYEIQHRPGRKHSNADALSRYPLQADINAINESEVCIPKMSAKEMRSAQMEDQTINHVMKWLESATRPTRESIAGTGTAVHYYHARFDQLQLLDGVACIATSDEDESDKRVRVLAPEKYRNDIIEAIHNSPVGGHFGVAKSLDKLREKFHWFKMKADIRDWCHRCKSAVNASL